MTTTKLIFVMKTNNISEYLYNKIYNPNDSHTILVILCNKFHNTDNNNTILVHYEGVGTPKSQAMQPVNNALLQSKSCIKTPKGLQEDDL